MSSESPRAADDVLFLCVSELTEPCAAVYFFAVFGDEPIYDMSDPEQAELQAAAMAAEESDDLTGLSFIFALLYLAFILPFISLLVFFFKRLSVNRLLKRVTIAAGSAIGLAVASAAYASAFGG